MVYPESETKMRTRTALVLATILLFGMIDSAVAESPTRIVVFTPTTEGNTYWPQVYAVLSAAADDLGVELLGFEFDVQDRFAKHTEGVEILRTTPDVDGAILSVAFGQTSPLLEAVEALGIPTILQGPLFPSELADVGYEPRRKYGRWIGTFTQDEFRKGYLLGETLVSSALAGGATAPDGTVHVAGIGGDPTWFGSQLRADGLRRAVADEPLATLFQIVPTRWTETEGYSVGQALLERYPHVSVMWAASDQLALGAARAVDSFGLTPGQDVLLGGLDLSIAALEAIENDLLSATVAASLTSYAEVLVYLYDYLHGYDFENEVGSDISLDVQLATRRSASDYLAIYRSLGAIDFSGFSRTHNPGLASYDFSRQALLAAMER